jgi:hypothetical protein
MVERCLRGLANVDTVVNDDFGPLRKCIDLDATSDDIDSLRGLQEVLGSRSGFGSFESELVNLLVCSAGRL